MSHAASFRLPATLPASEGDPAISVQGLHVQLGHAAILHAVDVAIPAGQWTAIAGPNGAGKSTLLRALAGLLPHTPLPATAPAPRAGQVHWWGHPLHTLPRREQARRMAWLGQNEDAAGDLRVWDVVMLGRMPHQGLLAAPSPQDHEAVRAALEAVQAQEWQRRPLGELSGGERQRVLLARALATGAELMLMDEPLMHLDPPHQADWIALVRALVAQGKTVVSVLHELNVAIMSDYMLLLQQGRVHHAGATATTATHRALETVFDGRVTVEALPHPGAGAAAARWVVLPA